MTSEALSQVGKNPDLGAEGGQDQEHGKGEKEDSHLRTSGAA